MMTVKNWLEENRLNEEEVELNFFDENGMSPYDDTDYDKYMNAPCKNIKADDEMYSIDCYFTKEVIYG